MYISGSAVAPVAFSDNGSAPTKLNPACFVSRRRRSASPLHLLTVKPAIVTKQVLFESAGNGMDIAAGEFSMQSADGLVRIVNEQPATGGMAPVSPVSYAIPIGSASMDRVVFTDIHIEESL